MDLSDVERPIPYDGDFTHWIAQVIRHRRNSAEQSALQQVSNKTLAMQRAAQFMAARGTGCVLDIATAYTTDRYASHASLLKIIPFAEMVSVNQQRLSESRIAAELLIEEFSQTKHSVTQSVGSSHRHSGPLQWGLSPHAPYTVDRLELMRAVAVSQRMSIPLAMHLAETREECDWLTNQSEPFQSFLGPHIDDSFVENRLTSVREAIEILSNSYRSMIVHGNYLRAEEIEMLKATKKIAVVYCPRTHAHFQHPRFPLIELVENGVPLMLGTDSLASNPDLDVFQEARLVRRQERELPSSMIWRWLCEVPRVFLELGQLRGDLVIGAEPYFAVLPLPEIKKITEQNLFDILLSEVPCASVWTPPKSLTAGS